jgi:hypothetical protein
LGDARLEQTRNLKPDVVVALGAESPGEFARFRVQRDWPTAERPTESPLNSCIESRENDLSRSSDRHF